MGGKPMKTIMASPGKRRRLIAFEQPISRRFNRSALQPTSRALESEGVVTLKALDHNFLLLSLLL